MPFFLFEVEKEMECCNKEKVEIVEEEEKPKKEKQLTMSDFFEEFKL